MLQRRELIYMGKLIYLFKKNRIKISNTRKIMQFAEALKKIRTVFKKNFIFKKEKNLRFMFSQ